MLWLPLAAVICSCSVFDGDKRATEFIISENSPPLGPYSSVVRAGDLLFTAGVIAYDVPTQSFADANIVSQTELAFDNLEAVLASADASLSDVVKVTVYLRDPYDSRAMNAIYVQRMGDARPARSIVPGVDWGRDDILIEIEAIARIPR